MAEGADLRFFLARAQAHWTARRHRRPHRHGAIPRSDVGCSSRSFTLDFPSDPVFGFGLLWCRRDVAGARSQCGTIAPL